MRHYMPTLDGWRAIAILFVITGHGNQAFAPSPKLVPVNLSAWGVDLFFGLSGLLIISKLAREVREDRLSLREFYLRRFFRLAPAAVAYLIGICLLAAWRIFAVTPGEVIASLFFYRNYYGSFGGPAGHYTGHYWSLSVEEQFYFIAPLALLALSTRTLLAILPPIAMSVGVWRIVESHHELSRGIFPNLDFDIGRTDLCLDHLLWGAWFALLASTARGQRLLRHLEDSRALPLVLLAFLLPLVIAIPAAKSYFAFAVPLALMATVHNAGSFVGRILESRPLAWIGKISYSLYLWQQLFLLQHHGNRPTLLADLPLGPLQNWPWGVPCTFLCATISFYFIEQPLRIAGYRWTGRMLRGHAAGVPTQPDRTITQTPA